MWQVKCERADGQGGKLVTRSWLQAVLQFLRWRLRGRPTSMSRYDGSPRS